MPDLVRAAEPGDATRIVQILHDSADELTRSRTVFGCSGVSTYVADAISYQDQGGDSRFFVLVRDERVIAFSEFRCGFDELFLNHIHVEPAGRGGTGQCLLHESLRLARSAAQGRVKLDVFVSNERAYSWYQALGFRFQERTFWAERALSTPDRERRGRWIIHGVSAAEAMHARFGFSHFTLETRTGSYAVGRLGDSHFRTSSSALAADEDALAALATLGPGRMLLYVGPDQEGRAGEVIGCSHRLVADVEVVLERLGQRLAKGTGW